MTGLLLRRQQLRPAHRTLLRWRRAPAQPRRHHHTHLHGRRMDHLHRRIGRRRVCRPSSGVTPEAEAGRRNEAAGRRGHASAPE